MEWQFSEDTVPSTFVTDAQVRSVLGKPPVTGGWRDGDPVGDRRFLDVGALDLEAGGRLGAVRIAYETWGTLSPSGDNAILVLHALTGDSHLVGPSGRGHPTAGWWSGIVGPGLALDTDEWFVVAPNMLGGCQGSTGPGSLAPDGSEWGPRFPYLTIRDQVAAQVAFSDKLGIRRWAGIIGGSMGGMHALEWGIDQPDRVARLAVLAAPPVTTADQVALNSVQIEAIRTDPLFRAGDYYDAEAGSGPSRGLALARRMALLNYRSPSELNLRFERSWQSDISPLGGSGRFAVESYLDFHGNKFTRRFDANSYITLVESMNSHDIGRGRGGVEAALARIEARTLVLGVDSDRLFPVEGQRIIAAGLAGRGVGLDGDVPVELESGYGHDGFLIESAAVGGQLRRLLDQA
jgi:homoserine O-acetyltransferase